jgi:hypothetical protein
VKFNFVKKKGGSSTFSSLVNYESTKAVVYSDQHVKRYAIGQFFVCIFNPGSASEL